MPTVLVIGATRGLGASLANAYSSQPNTVVYGTTRDSGPPSHHDKKSTVKDDKVIWLTSVDLIKPDVGNTLVDELKAKKAEQLDAVVSRET